MSKNIEKFNSRNRAPQGNCISEFILTIIIGIVLAFSFFKSPKTFLYTSESAGTPRPADSTLNGPARLARSPDEIATAPNGIVSHPTGQAPHGASTHTVSPLTNLLCGSSSLQGREEYSGIEKTEVLDTDKLLNSIVEKLLLLESNGKLNPAAGDNGDAVGPLQLHLCVLKDVNKYYGTNFVSNDRQDLEKSKWLAVMYIAMWLPTDGSPRLTIEEIAVRIFNGGPKGWRNTSTDNYWKKYKTQISQR